jgi:hypothetical protein
LINPHTLPLPDALHLRRPDYAVIVFMCRANFVRAYDGHVSIQNKFTKAWTDVKCDLQVPGLLLLRDESGEVRSTGTWVPALCQQTNIRLLACALLCARWRAEQRCWGAKL